MNKFALIIVLTVAGSMLSASANSSYQIYETIDQDNIDRLERVSTLQYGDSWVEDLAFLGEGNLIAVTKSDGSLQLWDLDAGVMRDHRNSEHRATSVSFNYDDTLLAVGSLDRVVNIWDVQSETIVKTLRSDASGITDVAFHPTRNVLVAVTGNPVGEEIDNRLYVWNVDTGEEVMTLSGRTAEIISVAMLNDGSQIASGDALGDIIIWDLETGERLRTLQGHEGWIMQLIAIPHLNVLVSTGRDATARIWDMNSGETKSILEHNSPVIYAIALSNDESILATGDGEGTIRFWDTESGELLHSLDAHDLPVVSLSFNATSNLLASGSTDGSVRTWGIRP